MTLHDVKGKVKCGLKVFWGEERLQRFHSVTLFRRRFAFIRQL